MMNGGATKGETVRRTREEKGTFSDPIRHPRNAKQVRTRPIGSLHLHGPSCTGSGIVQNRDFASAAIVSDKYRQDNNNIRSVECGISPIAALYSLL